MLTAACGATAAPTTPSGGAAPAGSVAAPASATPLHKVTFQLEWIPVGYDAPLVYGIESGIFKRNGLDVNWRWGTGSGAAVKAVGAGDVEFGEGAATAVLQLRAGGVPVRMVMGYLQKQAASIIVRADSDIHSPQDLKGKTLGVTPGGGTTLLLPAFLQHIHLPSSAIKIEDMSGSEKTLALFNRKTDAILSVGIEEQPQLAAQGLQTRLFNYADYGVNPLYLGIVATDATIAAQPAVVKAFVQSCIESIQASQRHPNATVQAVLSAAPATSPPKAVLLEQLKEGAAFYQTANDAGHPLGWQSPQDWQATVSLARRYLGYHGSTPPSQLYTNQFVAGSASS